MNGSPEAKDVDPSRFGQTVTWAYEGDKDTFHFAMFCSFTRDRRASSSPRRSKMVRRDIYASRPRRFLALQSCKTPMLGIHSCPILSPKARLDGDHRRQLGAECCCLRGSTSLPSDVCRQPCLRRSGCSPGLGCVTSFDSVLAPKTLLPVQGTRFDWYHSP